MKVLWKMSESASGMSSFHGNQPQEAKAPFSHPSPSEPRQAAITTF